MLCDEIRTQQFVREWGFFSRGTWYGSSSVKPSLALYQQYDCCTAVDTWSKLQNKSSASNFNLQGHILSTSRVALRLGCFVCRASNLPLHQFVISAESSFMTPKKTKKYGPPPTGKLHEKMQQKSSSRWGQTYSCFWVSQLSKEPCWTWETELQLTWSQLHSRCCMLCFHSRFDGNICNPPFCSSEITVLGIYFDVQRRSKNIILTTTSLCSPSSSTSSLDSFPYTWMPAEASITQSFFSKTGGSLALLPNIWSDDNEEYDTKPHHLVSVESLGICEEHGRLKSWS